MMIMDTYPKVCRAPMHGRGSILLLCLLPPSSTKFSEIEKNVSIFCTQLGDFIILKVFHWIELYIFHSLSFMVHAEMSENTFSSLTSKFSRAIACLRSTKFNYNFLPKSFKPNLAIFLKKRLHKPSSLLHNVNSKNVTKTCTCFITAFGRKGQK